MFQTAVSESGRHYINVDDVVDLQTERLLVVLKNGAELFFKLNTIRPQDHVLEIDELISDDDTWLFAYQRYQLRHRPTVDFKAFFYVWQDGKGRHVNHQPKLGSPLTLWLGKNSEGGTSGEAQTTPGGTIKLIESVILPIK